MNWLNFKESDSDGNTYDDYHTETVIVWLLLVWHDMELRLIWCRNFSGCPGNVVVKMYSKIQKGGMNGVFQDRYLLFLGGMEKCVELN